MIESLQKYGVFIGVLGTLLSIGATIFSVYAFRKTRVKKRIKLFKGEAYSIIKKNNLLTSDKITILWENKPVKDVYLLEIFLKNSGTKSLQKEDFLKAIEISFENDVDILNARLTSSSDYTKLNWWYKDRFIQVDVGRIESKKLIKLEIVYANDKPSPVDIDIAVLDGNIENKKIKNFEHLNYNNHNEHLIPTYRFIINKLLFILPILAVTLMFWQVSNINILNILSGAIVLAAITGLSLYFIVKAVTEKKVLKNVEDWTEYKSQNEIDKLNKFVQEYLAEDTIKTK